jgi:hypothetical protein
MMNLFFGLIKEILKQPSPSVKPAIQESFKVGRTRLSMKTRLVP